jgi:hypothetical protein
VAIISQPGRARDRESSLAAYERAFAFVAAQCSAPELESPADDDTNGGAH